METFPPRLWVTCRVIANENRLILLREIFETPRQCVGDLSKMIGLSLGSTSSQLKILCNEGFIALHRLKQEVRYDDAIIHAPPHIQQLQTSIKQTFSRGLPLRTLFKEATGLSHQRRIELIRRLSERPKSVSELLEETIMSYSALSRHLKKLETRNYVFCSSGQYRLGKPAGALAKTLLKITT